MPRLKKVKLSEEQLERCPYLVNQKKEMPIWKKIWEKIVEELVRMRINND